jgi:TIR domain
MNVFISHSSKDAKIAEDLAQALNRHDIHPVLDFVPRADGAGLAEALQQAALNADGFVFVLGTGDGADRKQELEWRYALRKQWDSEGSKPMIPVLLGDTKAPPFLRDRVAVRIPEAAVDYGGIAARIAHMIDHPDTTVDWNRRAEARVELKQWLGEMERFAAYIEASNSKSADYEKMARDARDIEM